MEFSVWNKAIYSSHRFLNIISKGGHLNPPLDLLSFFSNLFTNNLY